MHPTTTMLCSLLLPQVVGAATVTWLGGTGRWKEPRFWDSGSVPTSSDTVIIREGTVYLTEDRSITNLEVTDAGRVVLATTECPEGWAVLRRDSNGNSEGCAKAFSDARSWNDAELDCRAKGRGGVWRANSSDTLAGTGCYTNSRGERVCRVEDRETSGKMAREKYTRWLSNGTQDDEGGSIHGGYRGHLALIGDEETNRIVSILCAEASNASSLRYENSRAESTGQQLADVDACWIGLSMALDGDAMTHEMFENRAFRDGGAYGEHRAYGAKGAHPVPEQRSHHTQWSLDEHADVGNWAWVDEGAVPPADDGIAGFHGNLYRSWARHEPRYRLADTCAATLHRGYDPASQARARWTSAQCDTPKPYVCTRRGTTEQHTLIVSNTLTLKDGGILRGGGVVKPGTIVSNRDGYLDGAGLEASSLSTDLTGVHGAWLTISSTFTLSGRLLGHGGRVLGNTLSLSNGRCDWPVYADKVTGSGSLRGGGDLSRGELSGTSLVVDGQSLSLRSPPIDVLRLKADAPVIREDFEYAKEKVVTVTERTWRDWPSDAVRAAGFNHLHFRSIENDYYERGNVRGIGSYRDFDSNYGEPQRSGPMAGVNGLKGRLESALGAKDEFMTLERSAFVLDGRGNNRLGPAQGSYRLSVGTDRTECIPWHASAKEVSDAVNGLSAISSIGGATVNRRGDGSHRWGHAFHYEIAYDSAETATVPTLRFDCEGSNDFGTDSLATGGDCGCVDNVARAHTKPAGTCSWSGDPTSASDNQGTHLVAVHAAKHGDPGDYCLSRVFGSVDRIQQGGETAVSTTLDFREGWHRLSATATDVKVSGHHARVDVAAAAASYSTLEVSAGTVTFAGPGYRGDDAAALLWAPYDREWRAALALREGPSFGHKVTGAVTLSGGELRMASERLIDSYSRGPPHGSVTFENTLQWTGNGGIRGNGRLVVEGAATINTCVNHTECDRTLWPAHVRDCARVVLEGASTFQGGDIITGEGAGLDIASTLTMSGSANVLASPRPERTPGRQEDPLNDRGWYSNPACGDACARPPLVKIENGGTLSVEGSNVVEATLFTRGTLDAQGSLTLGDGGGGDGTFQIAAGGRVSQRNGLLDLERVKLRGEGELGITGGRLFLPGPTLIEPSLNVSGGEAAFRARRVLMASADVTVSNGTLSFLADATNGTLHGRFHLLNTGRVRFPERDSLAEPSRFHLSCPSREQAPNHPCQGPYTLDRSHVDIRGQTTWRGGTVSGGGDLHLRAASIVADGELKMWARVVNHGGMLLEDGQIIADTEGYLENRGTVEMVGPRTTYNGVTARRPRSETEVTLLHDWEDNMLREGRRVMVVGDDSARASTLGV